MKQGSDGISNPGDVENLRRFGTWGYGSAMGLAVLNLWLELVILESFSNLNNSLIL